MLIVVAVVTAHTANKTPSAPFRPERFLENLQAKKIVGRLARHGTECPLGVEVVPPPERLPCPFFCDIPDSVQFIVSSLRFSCHIAPPFFETWQEKHPMRWLNNTKKSFQKQEIVI